MSLPINSLTVDVGTKSLNALWARSNTISNNITNSDTPGYVAKEVDFEDELKNAFSGDTLTESSLANVNATVKDVPGTYGEDGNGVSLESQMVELSRNQLQFSYLERGVSDALGMLSSAAKGGR